MNTQTQFTGFRCPKPLLDQLKQLAENDHRSLSNLIVMKLAEAINETPPGDRQLKDHAA